MNNYLLLSPIFSFLILGFILFYLRLKIRQIKITPRDYLIFYNFLKKIHKYINFKKIINLFEEFKDLLINLLIKFLQRLKTDALRIQVWTEKYLNSLKEKINKS